jgi:hypothetical protein
VDDCGTPLTAARASRFELHSNFWLNLHNFLYKEARRRRGISDPGLGARGNLLQDTLPSRPLDGTEQRAWARALDYYERVAFDHQRFGDSLVIRINNRLTEAADGGDLSDVPLDPALREAGDAGVPVVEARPDSAAARAIVGIAEAVAAGRPGSIRKPLTVLA